MKDYSINISISGELGSGKSTVAAELARTLRFEVVSVGLIQRRLAEKYGMSATEFNRYMETHPEIDIECDNMVADMGRGTRMIFDSRLAWRFVPTSFKVYLKVDKAVAARRILGDKGRVSESFSALEEALTSITERRASELLRFRTQYGVDLDDDSNYDLVVHTDRIAPRDTALLITFLYINHAGARANYPKKYTDIPPAFLQEIKQYLIENENIS
jgi:cytidylate kinase